VTAYISHPDGRVDLLFKISADGPVMKLTLLWIHKENPQEQPKIHSSPHD
jgi:hypothetical protein